MSVPDRPARLAVLALVLVLFPLLATAIRPVWTIDPDASIYVSLARSLAAGEGYTLDGVPHTKYPPGLPILLSGVVRVAGPEAYAGFHAVLVTALLAAVWLAYLVTRRLGYRPVVAWSVAAATGLSQTLFDLSVTYLRTETVFLALTLGALLALWRAFSPSGGWPSATLAALLVVAACSVRLAGVGLLAVPALHALRPRTPGAARGRATLVLVVGLLALAAWQARTGSVARAFPGATNYGTEFTAAEPRDLTKIVRVDMPRLDGPALVRRVAGNLEVMTRAMAVLLTNVDRAGARLPVGALCLLLVMAGLHVMWWRPRTRPAGPDAVAYVLAMLAVCLVWPFNQQERFYVPLLPLLLVAAGEGLLEGLRLAGRFAGSRAGRALLLAGGGAVLLLLAAQRSDNPVLLGRWSYGYAALLAAAVLLGLLVARQLARGQLPALQPGHALLAVALIALPFLHRRVVEWPRQVAAFSERRAREPATGSLARIDVDPRLEAVALYLRDHTPADTVLMTDVPRMLQVMSGRRCIPFVYSVDPPAVQTDGAQLLFYTREIAEAAAVMDTVAPRLQPVLELDPVEDGGRLVRPTVYRAP